MEQAIEDAITALLKAWSDQGYSREDLEVEEEGRTITVNVETTMIYTHVLNRGGKGIRSPADAL